MATKASAGVSSCPTRSAAAAPDLPIPPPEPPSRRGAAKRARVEQETDAAAEALARIEDLGARNLQLSADIERLKRLCRAGPSRLAVGAAALQQVESDLCALQCEYRGCASLAQDALRRLARCSAQAEALAAGGGGATAAQLQRFRDACGREMSELLLQLEGVEQQQQTRRGDRQESEPLKQERSSWRQVSGGEPQAAAASSGAARMDAFACQLNDLRDEMATLQQVLVQESDLERRMSDAQDDAAARLQREVDELRSELCDALKELHRLKERTRDLRPDHRRSGGFHCALADAASDSSSSSQQQSASSSSRSSRRRPRDTVMELQSVSGLGNQPSWPSPHFSSRSSSVSGRLSVNQDENRLLAPEDEDEEEVERRLLEQHRLFWIKEGAGDAK